MLFQLQVQLKASPYYMQILLQQLWLQFVQLLLKLQLVDALLLLFLL